jgi:hypothetical protein
MKDDVQHPKRRVLEEQVLSSEMRGEIRDVSERVSSMGPPHTIKDTRDDISNLRICASQEHETRRGNDRNEIEFFFSPSTSFSRCRRLEGETKLHFYLSVMASF